MYVTLNNMAISNFTAFNFMVKNDVKNLISPVELISFILSQQHLCNWWSNLIRTHTKNGCVLFLAKKTQGPLLQTGIN